LARNGGDGGGSDNDVCSLMGDQVIPTFARHIGIDL
jgi:hypothetical protein